MFFIMSAMNLMRLALESFLLLNLIFVLQFFTFVCLDRILPCLFRWKVKIIFSSIHNSQHQNFLLYSLLSFPIEKTNKFAKQFNWVKSYQNAYKITIQIFLLISMMFSFHLIGLTLPLKLNRKWIWVPKRRS